MKNNTFNVLMLVFVFLIAAFMACSSKEELEIDHFDNAKQYIAQGKYQEAVLELKNAIQLNPENDAARLELGKVYMKLEEVPMAIQAYDAAVKANPENIEAHLKLGQVLLVAQNTLNARKAAKIILEKQPNHLGGLLLLAAVQNQEKNPSGAIQTLQQTIDAHPNSVRARLFLAELYNENGETELAEKTCLSAIDVDPAAALPYINLMRIYAENGRWDRAGHMMAQMVACSREYQSELIGLAGFFENKDKPDLALAAYSYAAQTAPLDTTEALRALGIFFARKGDYEQAMPALQKALDNNPEDVDVLANIAQLLVDRGDIESAAVHIERALDIDPEHVMSNFVKGVIAFLKRDYTAAENRFDYIITVNPNTAMAYYYKARCLFANDSMDSGDADLFRAAAGYNDDADTWIQKQAESNLEKAIELAPEFLPARLMLARIYLQNQDMDDAERQIEAILAVSSDHEKALGLQGTLLLLQKDYEGAKTVCEKMLSQDPDSSQWLARLGVVYAAMGRMGDAMYFSQRAIAKNPKQFGALQLMVDSKVAEKKYGEAVSLCDSQREAAADSPTSKAILDHMAGKVFLAKGDFDDARLRFSQAIENAPDFLSPRMALARIELYEGRLDDAVIQLEGVLGINNNYLPACMVLGDVHYILKNKALAIKFYRAALKIEANHDPAANNLAYVLSEYDDSLAEALGLAQIAVNKVPENPTYRDTLGWIHYRMGNMYMAQKELEKSLYLDSNGALANYHMGLVCYKNKDFDKARSYVQKALEIDPEFEAAEDARALLDK